LLLGECQAGLGLLHLRRVLRHLGLLHGDLCVDVLDAGLRRRDLPLRLGKCIPVITVVYTSDHLAGDDVFVVGDWDGCDVARYLRGDRELARRDEGVISGLEVSGVIEVEIARGRDQYQTQQSERRGDWMTAKAAFASAVLTRAVPLDNIQLRVGGRVRVGAV